MKKIFKYFGVLLSFALMGAFTACGPMEDDLSADIGLGVKVFFPTKVVAGQPMTINGSGLANATEIVFPTDVVVTDFEVVSNEMIRVVAPAGINPEGGNIVVRTADDEAESPLPLTLGGTVVSGYSRMPGETVKGGEQITIYGEDLEFITSVELKDPDGNPLVLNHGDFYRKGTSSVVITVPRKVYSGAFAGIIRTYDDREFIMDEFVYEEAKDEGYWEITKRYLWKNEGDTAVPAWGGTFRFSSAEASTGEEIYAFPMEDWALIKEGVVRIEVKTTDASNIRITDGWWSAAYGGAEHNCLDFVQTDDDGNQYIELNIKEDGNLYGVIDVQHLLLTGSDYEILSIYVQEETWVEGAAGHWEKNTLWKSEGGAVPAWDSKYRFSNAEASTGEEIYAFPMEDWALIKEGVVRVAVKATEASNIRITTGWWTGAYGGAEHNCLDFVQEAEDGTQYIELNIKEEGSLYENIDVQHLLFTGSDYELLEIYTEVWVEGGGSGPKEVVFWENPDPAGNGEISWNGTYRFALDGNDSLNECIATFPQEVWDVIKNGTFYMHANGFSTAQMRVTDGWWSVTWTGNDIMAGDERLVDNGDGTFTIEINLSGDPLVDVIDAQHLLFTGGGYTPLRLYYME